MGKIRWGILFLLFLQLSVQAQTTADALKRVVSDPLLKTTQVGIAVFNLTTGESLFTHHADQLFRPASVQKVATAVTALARLGEDSSLTTELGYRGSIQNDTLYGSLYVVGGGNPLFSESDMHALIEALTEQSIRYITDSIVADLSRTDSLYWGPGWSWDDAPYTFQPAISSLMLNKGCVEVTVSPTQVGQPPLAHYTPLSAPITLRNQAVTTLRNQGKVTIQRNWSVQGDEVTVGGQVAQVTKKSLPVSSSYQLFLSELLYQMRLAGIEGGTPVVSRTPVERMDFIPLVLHELPLGQLLAPTLKESDNVCAEALFFQLGTQYTDSCTTLWKDGQQAVNLFMQEELGFLPDNYRIADGSGLSLYNYLSPSLLIAFLKYAYYHPAIFQPFYASLPIAGVDGTLHYRMKEGRCLGNVRAKTGSVSGVSSLAGYVKASNGDLLAFVIMNQGVLKLRTARAFQDRICTILAQ
ncbi:MAG: D-alanyl-D-alanine carboxypeptidase/D-alanyl-D-alanine endopeptidase [Phocaeicola sp.]